MAALRRLAGALGRHSDYSYKKQFRGNAQSRRCQQRAARNVTRRARRIDQRESARIIADER